MTSYVENETDVSFPFTMQEILEQIMETVLETENCPYETTVNLLLTDRNGIREYNREYRDLDKETDVLSFPNIPFISSANCATTDFIFSSYIRTSPLQKLLLGTQPPLKHIPNLLIPVPPLVVPRRLLTGQIKAQPPHMIPGP